MRMMMSRTYKACANYLVIELDPIILEEKSEGGIVVPVVSTTPNGQMHRYAVEQLENGQDVGTVVDVGPNCVLGYEAGDRVFFERYSGKTTRKLNDSDKKYAIIPEKGILALVKDE